MPSTKIRSFKNNGTLTEPPVVHTAAPSSATGRMPNDGGEPVRGKDLGPDCDDKQSQPQPLKRLLLYRNKLHVQRIIFSVPRFHFLGFLWAVIELVIFFITTAQMDFEALDTVTLMLRLRVTQQIFVDKDAQSLLGDYERDTIVSMSLGSFRPSSAYCGPHVNSGFAKYIRAHAFDAIKAGKYWNDPTGGGALLSDPDTALLALRNSFAFDEKQEEVRRHMLQLMLCNRSEPLIDQRYILSNIGQECTGPGLLLDINGGLDLCQHPEQYNFQLLVAGTRSVCIFFNRDNSTAIDKTLGVAPAWPVPEWAVICIHFGTRDLVREDCQWIFRRLRVLWDRFKASALAWILLSAAMRVLYWWRMVEATKRSLVHLRTECTAEQDRPFIIAPNGTNGSRHLSLQKTPKEMADESLAAANRTVGSFRRGKEKETRGTTIPHALSPNRFSSGMIQTWMTAASIGIACANNDSLYLALAVVRQIVGAPYAEMLLGSAVTTPLAAWQAFGIVIYHEAIILLIFHGVDRLLRGRRSVINGVTDVGVLGYFSMLFLCLSVQSSQLFNIDVLWLFRTTNALNVPVRWLILPGASPDGACLWSRGEIFLHTLAAVYTSVFALLAQSAVNYCRHNIMMSSCCRHPRRGRNIVVASTSGDHQMRRDSSTSTWWLYLGTISCPSCSWRIVTQPTLIPTSPSCATASLACEKAPRPSAVTQCDFQASPTRPSSSPGDPPLGNHEKDHQGPEISSTSNCCLSIPCTHSLLSEEDNQTEKKVRQTYSRYRFISTKREPPVRPRTAQAARS